MGLGPVGFFSVQAARAWSAAGAGARPGARPARLAAGAGAEPIDVTERQPADAVAEATDGRGADIVIEAVGHPEAFETAVGHGAARRPGRRRRHVHERDRPVQLGVWWARAIDLRFAGVCPVHAWWERAMSELEAGRLDPAPLISHRLPLEEAVAGYELFDRAQATKVLLIP